MCISLFIIFWLIFFVFHFTENSRNIYTITNWRVSLSKICHEWTNNAVTQECAQWVTILFGHELDYLTTHTSISYRSALVNYKKGCTRLTAASDKVYQLPAHGRWFSLASSTTKTGRHGIAEILLKVALTLIIGRVATCSLHLK
jgi:hypothetical protein